KPAADCCPDVLTEAEPPNVTISRVTGAGDTLMAVHMAREMLSVDRPTALDDATAAAARYVAGEDI
ncbi:MAG: kinase, partial [Pseudomonadota bacterium]